MDTSVFELNGLLADAIIEVEEKHNIWDCDILERNGVYYVLELNPRFGGGFPFSYEAGVNMPGAIISWAKGLEFDTSNLHPKYGKLFAKCDYLIERPNL